MLKKEIPIVTDEFDIKLLFYSIRKSILWMILFIIIAAGIAFLYLRYTSPIYQVDSIIQLKYQNPSEKLLMGSKLQQRINLYEQNLSQDIALLKSPVFLQQALSKLPLSIDYYVKGAILDFEQYTGAPYKVDITVKNEIIYDIPIYIEFLDENRVATFYKIPGAKREEDKEFKRTILVNETARFEHFDITLSVLNYQKISEIQNIKNTCYFVVNNPQNIIPNILSKLQVNILDAGANTIQILTTDKNPQKATDIVNTLAQEFIVYDEKKKSEGAAKILSYIDSQLVTINKDLYDLETKIQLLKETYNIKEEEEEKNFSSSNAEIQKKLELLEEEAVKIEEENSVLSEIEKNFNESPNTDIYKLISLVSVVQSLQSTPVSSTLGTLQQLLLQKEKLMYEVTANSGQIEALNYQIDIQTKLLLKIVSSLKNKNEIRIKTIDSKIEELKSKLFTPFASDGYDYFEYYKLKKLHELNNNYYQQLIQQKAEYSIIKEGYVSANNILKTSSPPDMPISPIKRSTYIKFLTCALILCLLLIAYNYFFQTDILSIEDIKKFTDIAILGVIPKYKVAKNGHKLYVAKNPKSLLAEAFRSIRSNLHFISPPAFGGATGLLAESDTPASGGGKVIAISSTIAKEGKTSISINIGAIIALSEKKVILLDMDLRKPSLHTEFNIDNKKGITTILIGENTIEECIHTTEIPNLHFIPAGPVPPNPSELIMSKNMNDTIEILKTHYDIIVIDNSPVGLVVDAIPNLLRADYPLYIMRANHSKKSFLKILDQIKTENKLNNLSIILNTAKGSNTRYGYGYYGSSDYYTRDYYYDESQIKKSSSTIRRLFSKLYSIF